MEATGGARAGPAAALLTVAILGSLIVGAVGGAGQSEGVFYVNVVEAENLGCSSDNADFKVHLSVGEFEESTREITHDNHPVWGTVHALPGGAGTQVEVRVSEGESFLWSDWRYNCDITPGPGRAANLTYDGTTKRHTLRGDGPNATALTVVIGHPPPDAPTVNVEETTTSSATLNWTVDTTADEQGEHRVFRGWSGELATLEADQRTYTWDGLQDNTKHAARVLTAYDPWLITSEIVTFETENAPPPAPTARGLAWGPDTLELEWANARLHDGDRLEAHAVGSAEANLTNETRVKDRGYPDRFAWRWEEMSVPWPTGATHLVLKATDTADATTRSDPIELPPTEPRIERAVERDAGVTVRFHHDLTKLDHVEVHTGSHAGFEADDGSEVARRSNGLGKSPLSITGIEVPADATHVRVVGVHGDGTDRVSEAVELEEDPGPPAPTEIEAVRRGDDVTVRWSLESTPDLDQLDVLTADAREAPRSDFRVRDRIDLDANPGTDRVRLSYADDVHAVFLRVHDTAGQTTVSSIVPVVDGTAPQAPAIELATADEGTLSLRFDHEAPDDLDRYEVHVLPRENSTLSARSHLATAEAPVALPHEMGNLSTPNDARFVAVRAVDAAGNQATSPLEPIDRVVHAPPEPVIGTVTQTQAGFHAAWIVNATEHLEAFRLYASERTPVVTSEANRVGPEVAYTGVERYAASELEVGPGDRYLVVQALGDDTNRTSDPAPIPGRGAEEGTATSSKTEEHFDDAGGTEQAKPLEPTDAGSTRDPETATGSDASRWVAWGAAGVLLGLALLGGLLLGLKKLASG